MGWGISSGRQGFEFRTGHTQMIEGCGLLSISRCVVVPRIKDSSYPGGPRLRQEDKAHAYTAKKRVEVL